MKLSREAKIGLLVTGALACFIWGINFLKGKDLFTLRKNYYAVYDKVDGLVESNPVTINGMAVGKVNKVFLHPDNSGRIIVHMILNESDFEIPRNTSAVIYSTSMLGGKGVELKLGNASEKAVNGDTLSAGLDGGLMAQLDPIKSKTEKLMGTIDSLLTVVKTVLNKDATADISKAIKSFSNTAQNIDQMVADQKSRLNAITSHVESITANLKQNNGKLTNIINNFSSISDSLAKANLLTTISNANKAIQQTGEIVQKINSGKGSVGMLVNNDTLYRNLESSSKNLDLLVEDLRLHPKRYVHLSVFGRKEKPYKKDDPKATKK